MSDWTENENRVDIPYPLGSRYVCVEHPACVANDDKALQTIGGVESVIKAYNSPSQRIALRWRPEDKYSKPCYGDRYPTTNLLMKVKKRRRKSDGKEEYKIEILGRIETTYRFQSMCDFQYLPVRRQEDGSYENIYDKIVMNKFNTDQQQYFSQDVPLFIPPILFSRVDKPIDFLYRQDIEHRQGYRNPDKTRPANLIGTVRQRRSIYTIFVNFGENVPTAPLQQAVDKLTSEYVDPKGADVVREFLDQKPLWLKVELEFVTGMVGEKLKLYLPALCFYWLDGPWRGQWNKFGYNPTEDPSSKIHQTLDFRLRQINPSMVDIKAKRSDFKVVQRNQLSRTPKHNVRINIKALGGDWSEKGPDEVDKELFYKFIPGKNPPQRMMYYPIQYIEIDEVQRLIHSNDGKELVCTERDGWCIEGFHDKCRDIMYNNIHGLEDYKRIWKHTKKKRKKTKGSVYSFKAPPNVESMDYEATEPDGVSVGTSNIGISEIQGNTTDIFDVAELYNDDDDGDVDDGGGLDDGDDGFDEKLNEEFGDEINDVVLSDGADDVAEAME